MNWIEVLPDECPPKEAFKPEDFKVYRLAKEASVDERDFQSQRALKPNKVFKGLSECLARSLSVYNNVAKCLNMTKLPVYKKRWKAVLEITLEKEDGLILKTFTDPNHYSWWRTTNFSLDKAIIFNSNEKTT